MWCRAEARRADANEPRTGIDPFRGSSFLSPPYAQLSATTRSTKKLLELCVVGIAPPVWP
jgi:hypothetical protein